jgi:hypothetical protein
VNLGVPRLRTRSIDTREKHCQMTGFSLMSSGTMTQTRMFRRCIMMHESRFPTNRKPSPNRIMTMGTAIGRNMGRWTFSREKRNSIGPGTN